jgi:hypothetical protein
MLQALGKLGAPIAWEQVGAEVAGQHAVAPAQPRTNLPLVCARALAMLDAGDLSVRARRAWRTWKSEQRGALEWGLKLARSGATAGFARPPVTGPGCGIGKGGRCESGASRTPPRQGSCTMAGASARLQKASLPTTDTATGAASRLARPATALFSGHHGPNGCTIATQSQVLPGCGLAERGASKLPCGQTDDFARQRALAGIFA